MNLADLLSATLAKENRPSVVAAKTRIARRTGRRRRKEAAEHGRPGSEPAPLRAAGRTSVWLDGRRLLYFSGCDYYRLASHPEILRVAADAPRRYGISVSASRMTTGNHELYQRLERALAGFFRSEAALLMPTGYLCATAVVQSLADRTTHALIDERSHACLFDAAGFLKCPVCVFKHRNPGSLEMELRKVRDSSRLLLLTDGMFAHDGSAAPLRAYRSVLPRTAVILVDDAHGAGVLGVNGRGTLEHETLQPGARVIQTITLSKAFGAYGGAVLCSSALRRVLLTRARVFVGSTPVPLPLAAAALRSLEQISTDGAMRQRLRDNTAQLRAGLKQQGLEVVDTPGPIVRLELAPAALTEAARRLTQHGVLPPVVSYLGNPPALRFVVSSQHTAGEIKKVVQSLCAASVA